MPDADVALPAKCFISHAYADAKARDDLIDRLPEGVTPFVFPPITVRPEEFVSDPLIDAVLDCDGLIYLRGGASDRSFWVALERDYAASAGKQVFAFDTTRCELTRDLAGPLDLVAFASYHGRDAGRVQQITNFLNRNRHFDLWLDATHLAASGDWQKEISASLSERLARGGYAVVFWSRSASESRFVHDEIERAVRGMAAFNDRVLFAVLAPCPLPESWQKYHEPSVQLYGDSVRSATQRLDDLIVRLHWLIYRKTRLGETEGRRL